MLILECLFWISGLLLVWVYLGYPVSLGVLSRLRRPRLVVGPDLPKVTLVVSAFNEAGVIREKLLNTLAIAYPREQLEVLVISDASDDGTDAVVREFEAQKVTLCRQEPRGGKSRGLTRFVPGARGEILVFSDANSLYDPQALRRLVRHFADPQVGYVVGHQRYSDDHGSAASRSESLYWSYEIYLKQCESRLGSVVGGDGAIYAIRAALFTPLRDDDINDFVNPLQIVWQGYRGVFDPEAVCYERAASSFHGEFRRKIRIVNRSVRGLFRVPGVLNPLRVGWFAYEILFHKLLRWFAPYLIVLVFATNLALVGTGNAVLYQAALAAQLVFYALALCGLNRQLQAYRCVYLPYYFCLVNAAALAGTLSALLGRTYTTWKPERADSAASTPDPERPH